MKKRTWLKICIALLLLVCMLSGYKILSYYIAMQKDAQGFKKLAQTVEANALQNQSYLARYQSLQQQNADFFGWIQIKDTNINYPVMHTPQNPEFYLHRAFDKSYSPSGVPFLAADCFVGCGNYLIYGHNMKNGSMFADLLKYQDKAYWQQHQTIHFDTLHKQAEYKVVAAFKTYDKAQFKYYEYADLTDEKRFDAYIKHVKANALYDTRVHVQYGDELITLSTCSYHTTNGRFVVVAKKAAASHHDTACDDL